MLIDSPTSEQILQFIDKSKLKRASDFLILCGENVVLDIPELIELLNANGIKFCGGIFPKIIFGKKSYSDKILLLPVIFESDPIVITNLDSENFEIGSLDLTNDSGSLFILVDGLSNYVSKFTYSLYKEIGPDYQVFGSGAGYGNFDRRNCVFNKDGFFKDAAVVTLIENKITQSIRHGWKPIAGPYIATKTTANLLQQINWQPAYQVHKEIIEKEEGIELTRENYYEHAKHYPFSVHRSDSENLIRDPVEIVENDSIRFGAEIPSNAVLYLMKSETDSMLAAGKEACIDAIGKTKTPKFLFFADCITRTWVLNERFEEEICNINDPAELKNIPVYGVLSLGEISSVTGALLNIHHKTIAISIIETYGE